jgi:predicted patatin/cPLA2 family phospholipase
VGGGMRGIYAAGVLDCCLDEQVTFDDGIGISAGSANIASFLAHQRGRNKRYFLEYSFRKEYMSLSNYRTKGSFLNLDYIYGTLSNSDGEYPLDYQAIIDNPTIINVLACNAWTGETKIFYKSDLSLDNYDIFKASCAIPSICKPYYIDEIPYFDGALGDTIPLDMVEDYDRTVLILTKPKDTIRTSRKDDLLARRIEKQYPKAAEQLHLRAVKYNAGVAKAKDLEKTGKLLIIAPENTEGVDTLTRDKGAFLRLYTRGYMDGHQVKEFINRHA